MDIGNLKSRIKGLPDNTIVLIEGKGKKYEILTAKKFRNNKRVGPKNYFGIVIGIPISSMESL